MAPEKFSKPGCTRPGRCRRVQALGRRSCESGNLERACASEHRGFTLWELLLALLLVSVFLAAALPGWLELNRMVLEATEHRTLRAAWERTLMLMQSESLQAGYGFPDAGFALPLQLAPEELSLQADLNRDGVLDGPRERISYRFDATRKLLLRRSGGASFQSLLEPVEFLRFEESPYTGCVRLRFQLLPEDPEREALLCRSRFQHF